MENFSTSHCSENEIHDICVDYAMQGIFTDSLMPCNSSLISNNISILTSCMHPQAHPDVKHVGNNGLILSNKAVTNDW